MIEIKGLKKSFGKHEVLRGIDLTIQDKEVVVIIGRPGPARVRFSAVSITWKNRRPAKSSSTASA